MNLLDLPLEILDIITDSDPFLITYSRLKMTCSYALRLLKTTLIKNTKNGCDRYTRVWHKHIYTCIMHSPTLRTYLKDMVVYYTDIKIKHDYYDLKLVVANDQPCVCGNDVIELIRKSGIYSSVAKTDMP